jgi:hypothetical protein
MRVLQKPLPPPRHLVPAGRGQVGQLLSQQREENMNQYLIDLPADDCFSPVEGDRLPARGPAAVSPLTKSASKGSLPTHPGNSTFFEGVFLMVSLAGLWLPILLAAVVVFVASSIMHMVLPYHKSDYTRLPDEEKVLSALRGAGLKRGLYMFPFCTHQEMKNPEVIEKYKQGPVGFLTVFPPGPVQLPKFLAQWFVYCLIVSFFAAYLAGHTVAPGTPYLGVFRVVGTAAFLAYGIGQLSNGIWKGQMWGMTIKEVIDGLVYGLLTAGVFGWLWPR